MSITRKMLKGMSLTEEQIDTIVEAHTETVDALKDEVSKYTTAAERLPAVEKELNELKATGGDFEQKYNALKEEYENYKTEQSAAAEKRAKEEAYKEMLKEAGVSEKRIASVMRVTNLSEIKLDKDGKLTNKDKLVEDVKKEWADFIDTKETKGADVKKPPENNGGKMTKEEILKIKDTAERQQKIAENLELFGYTTHKEG